MNQNQNQSEKVAASDVDLPPSYRDNITPEMAAAAEEKNLEADAPRPPPTPSPSREAFDPRQLKAVFDKMTEIDTNPTSKASLAFHKQLEEMESDVKSQRQGEVTIKTIRRGRVRQVS